MGAVTLQDIRLFEYNFENLPLLKRLREGLLSEKPRVCIERARYYTEYLRDMSPDKEPAEIRYAKAAKHFLSNKTPFFLMIIFWPGQPHPSLLEHRSILNGRA